MKIGDIVRIVQRKKENTTGRCDYNKPNGDAGTICKVISSFEVSYELERVSDGRYVGYFDSDDVVPMVAEDGIIVGRDIIKEIIKEDGSIKTNKKPFMEKITSMFKLLVDSDTQDLKKAGYINGDLELTSEGQKELIAITFAANKAALVAAAQAKIAEEAKK